MIAVHPEHENADIRPAYLEHVLAALNTFEPQVIISGTLEDQANGVEFLEDNGFRPVLRETSSEMNVVAFDETRFSHILERMRAAGIEIVTIQELQEREPAWKPKLYELFWTILEDVPSTDPVIRRTLAEFKQSMLSGPSYNVDSWFVALDGGQLVGMSQGRPNPVDPENMYSGLTGVAQSHRRRGIATALKLHVIAYAREAGIKKLVAFNEENNPMFQLNLALGFEPKPAWVTYEKRLG